MSAMQVTSTGRTIDADHPKRQSATEHVALDSGLLRLCPRCGKRYRAHGKALSDTNYCSFAAYDPALLLFCGDVDTLLTAVDWAVTQHDTVCTRCLQ